MSLGEDNELQEENSDSDSDPGAGSGCQDDFLDEDIDVYDIIHDMLDEELDVIYDIKDGLAKVHSYA